MSSMRQYIIGVCIIIMCNCMIFGQDPIKNNLLQNSALPDVEFYDILEDTKQNIWLAADKGLFKYDGYDYKKKTHINQKGSSVFGLKLDAKAHLWCNNLYGQLFYVNNDRLELFLDISSITNGQFFHFEILERFIVVYTNSGIYKIDKVSKAIEKQSDQSIVSVALGTEHHYFYSESKPSSIQYIEDNKLQQLVGIHAVNIESTGFFKLNTQQLLFKYKDKLDNVLYHINTPDNSITRLETPTLLKRLDIYNILRVDESVWFCTTNGLLIYDLKDGVLKFKAHYFKEEAITDLIKDFNQNYWFTTIDNGVFVVPNMHFKELKDERITGKIAAICHLENNEFVIGTKEGILWFFKDLQVVSKLELPKAVPIKLMVYDAFNKQLIISNSNSNSFLLDIDSRTFTATKNKFAIAKAIAVMDSQTLFYGNYKEAKVFKNDTAYILRSKRVVAAQYLGKHQLLIAYIDGLYVYDLQADTYDELKVDEQSLMVANITQTDNGVYVYTQDGMLYDNDSKQLSKVLHDLDIQTVQSDAQNLWMIEKEGLLRMQTSTQKMSQLTSQDGLVFHPKNILVMNDYIILTTPMQVFALPKQEQQLFKTYKTTDVFIESVEVNDVEVPMDAIENLDFDQNKLKVAFNSRGYLSRKHVSYSYQLTPLDTSWQTVSSNTNFIEFKELQSGAYKLLVRAKNHSGKQYSNVAMLAFNIRPPFWKTWWFYVLIGLLIFGVLFLWFAWRMRLKERRKAIEINQLLLEKKMATLKLENFRSQMNPHFIFNALNSIQDYIISNEKELASTYLVKFSRLIRIYLEYSQQNEISLDQELNALALYLELEKVRFEDDLAYEINVDKRLDVNRIKVPSLFIQPYIENALKHGLLHKKGDRQLRIMAICANRILKVVIEDNGIGREHAKRIAEKKRLHKPFATKANEARIHIYKTKLKQDINVDIEDLTQNGEPSGTRVNIYIPLKL